MDLLTKVVVLAVALVVALFLLYYGFSMIPIAPPTQQQASKNITNYLDMIYPGANVTITDIRPSQYSGSWHVVASVIENSTTPCPLYQSYSYDYPAFGLVNGTDNIYTHMNASGCIFTSGALVGSLPVAMAMASKNFAISHYIQNFGFANVTTSAISENVTISGRQANVWNVSYSSRLANYTIYAVLSQLNGTVLKTFNKSR